MKPWWENLILQRGYSSVNLAMRCIHVRQSPPGAAPLTALSTGLGELADNVDDADLPPRKETETAAASVELFSLAPRPGPIYSTRCIMNYVQCKI